MTLSLNCQTILWPIQHSGHLLGWPLGIGESCKLVFCVGLSESSPVHPFHGGKRLAFLHPFTAGCRMPCPRMLSHSRLFRVRTTGAGHRSLPSRIPPAREYGKFAGRSATYLFIKCYNVLFTIVRNPDEINS